MNFRRKNCVSHMPHACSVSWNGRMREQFLQVKSLVPSSLLRSQPHRAWSVAGAFYMRHVSQCKRTDFTEISKFPEIPGELSLHKQCVPHFFPSAHAWEPGKEAICWHSRLCLFTVIQTRVFLPESQIAGKKKKQQPAVWVWECAKCSKKSRSADWNGPSRPP